MADRAAVPGRRRAVGFTLVELAVVLGIVSILAAAAAPGFRSFIDAMEAKDVSMELVADLTHARSEALKRNASVTMTPQDGDWSHGWQVRTGDIVLRARSATRAGLSLTAPAGGVTYLPSGRLSTSDAVTDNAAWSITPANPQVAARCVVVTPTGSARAKRGGCA
jgi:type IV fimbrial biogenesis protein FimT